MKKIYFLLFICIAGIVQAQGPVPNAGFELWNSATYEIPQYYVQSSNTEVFFRAQAPFNCVKTTDAFHGNYALKLTTVAGTTDTSMGYVVNSNPGNGNPCQWSGGIPYNQKPTGIKGHYKSSVMPGDSAGILMIFKNAGVCLGMYIYKFGGTQSTYTPFSFTFSPALPATPDTVIFGAVSSDVFNDIQKVGSMIQLDSLAFTGVGSQPAMFNGDFETWQSKTIKSPVDWFINTDGEGEGFNQTTDVYSGTYAIELVTYLGDNNGIPRASGGGVSTGYNYCDNGPCVTKGGYPFTNQVDTLSFYYKYAPSGSDSAAVNLTFKKNGSVINNIGKYIKAAGTYTNMEVPFNVGSSPDTVVIEFRSSAWNDTALSFIGSSLKIDALRFKSQPVTTGIIQQSFSKTKNVYPNPSSDGTFYLGNVGIKDQIVVYNILGESVNVVIKRENNTALVGFPSGSRGIYFIQITSSGKTITEKVIIE